MGGNEKIHIPKEESVVLVLSTLDQFGVLSAKQISEKFKNEKELKKLGILDKDQVPSYPTINRILSYLYKTEKKRVNWIPEFATKEKKYKITEEGRRYLRVKRCDLGLLDVFLNPKSCDECGKEKIEECWKEKIDLMKAYIEENILGFKIKWEESDIAEIKKILEMPVRISQFICCQEHIQQLESVFQENLAKPFFNRIKCGLRHVDLAAPEEMEKTKEENKKYIQILFKAYNELKKGNSWENVFGKYKKIKESLLSKIAPEEQEEAIHILKLEARGIIDDSIFCHFIQNKEFRNLVWPWSLYLGYIIVDFPSLKLIKLKDGDEFIKRNKNFIIELKNYLKTIKQK